MTADTPTAPTEPLCILVVDDEPDIEPLVRQRFRREIREGRYQFLFAQNGVQALAQVDAHPEMSVILTDLNMPEMDGLTLLAEVQNRDRILKTVVVSAYGDLANIRVAMNRGAFDFLTKPIDFQDLAITIERTAAEVDRVRHAASEHRVLSSLRSELHSANLLQQSILPQEFPCEGGQFSYEVFARMVPAKSVGGDFYDFFHIDESRLGVVIGDVSGKGMPAAIYMAVARTLVKAWGLTAIPPDECLTRVNRALCDEGKRHVFVTIFYGVLDTVTGHLEFANGGHNPPVHFGNGRPPELLDVKPGLVLGIDRTAVYQLAEATLSPGDTLLLYTDGVTEAMNATRDCFQDDRLLDVTARHAADSLADLLEAIYTDVNAFAGDAPQHDDMTALAVRYCGRAPERNG